MPPVRESDRSSIPGTQEEEGTVTHWQLDPSGRFPQACFDHVKALDPATVEEAYLLAWAWLLANGFYYENSDENRLTGIHGYVDCSGGVVLCTHVARAVMGLPNAIVPGNSGYMAQVCHNLSRPRWMIDRYGPGHGYGLTANQANSTPAALAFHGDREGQDGFGDGGHVKSKYFIHRDGDPNAGPNVSVEAMSHALDLRYSTFLDHKNTYFALSPWLGDYAPAVHPSELDMLTFLCPNKKPTASGQLPRADFYPAGSNAMFPNGALLLHDGARLNGDSPTKDPRVHLILPDAHKWISCGARHDAGLYIVNDAGDTSPVSSLAWA